MPDEAPTLQQLIRSVSHELLQSRDAREMAGEPPLFEVEHVTLELSVVVAASTTGEAGFDLKVIKAGGAQKYDRESIHKVIVKLKSLDSGDVLGDELPLRPRPVG